MSSSLGVRPTLDMSEAVSRRRSHCQSEEEVNGVDSRFVDSITKQYLKREGEASSTTQEQATRISLISKMPLDNFQYRVYLKVIE